MALDRITLTRFRNHDASRLDGSARLNLLVGENGAGKTNVLEALSLLAPGRGLRRAGLVEMAEDGTGAFAVSAELDCGDASERVVPPSTHSIVAGYVFVLFGSMSPLTVLKLAVSRKDSGSSV